MEQKLSKSDRWLTESIDSLVKEAKKSKFWSLALSTADAMTPTLMRFGQVYVSEQGDIEVFVWVLLPDMTKKAIFANVVAMSETGESKAESTTRSKGAKSEATEATEATEVTEATEATEATENKSSQQMKVLRTADTNNGARELVAAFICDFPNAVFTIDTGKPIQVLNHETRSRSFMTLNNMITETGTREDGTMTRKSTFSVLVPKPDSVK